MKSAAVVTSIPVLGSGFAWGEEHRVEPTEIESYVATLSVVIDFTRLMGSIDSTVARAEVVALVADDSSNLSHQM